MIENKKYLKRDKRFNKQNEYVFDKKRISHKKNYYTYENLITNLLEYKKRTAAIVYGTELEYFKKKGGYMEQWLSLYGVLDGFKPNPNFKKKQFVLDKGGLNIKKSTKNTLNRGYYKDLNLFIFKNYHESNFMVYLMKKYTNFIFKNIHHNSTLKKRLNKNNTGGANSEFYNYNRLNRILFLKKSKKNYKLFLIKEVILRLTTYILVSEDFKNSSVFKDFFIFFLKNKNIKIEEDLNIGKNKIDFYNKFNMFNFIRYTLENSFYFLKYKKNNIDMYHQYGLTIKPEAFKYTTIKYRKGQMCSISNYKNNRIRLVERVLGWDNKKYIYHSVEDSTALFHVITSKFKQNGGYNITMREGVLYYRNRKRDNNFLMEGSKPIFYLNPGKYSLYKKSQRKKPHTLVVWISFLFKKIVDMLVKRRDSDLSPSDNIFLFKNKKIKISYVIGFFIKNLNNNFVQALPYLNKVMGWIGQDSIIINIVNNWKCYNLRKKKKRYSKKFKRKVINFSDRQRRTCILA